MPAKKAVAKKSSSKAAETGSKDARWTRQQLTQLAEQSEAASTRGDSWLVEAHAWHKAQLVEVLNRLESDCAAVLPEELKEGVAFYLSQFAGGTVTCQDEFYDDHEMYADFLKADIKDDDITYVRDEETSESLEAIKKVQDWESTSQQGISKLAKLASQDRASVGVQEALLQKIIALMLSNKDRKGSDVAGLAPEAVVKLVVITADRFPRDAALQLAAINALQTIAKDIAMVAVVENGGVQSVLSTLQRHKTNADVCLIGSRLISFLISKAKAHSPEWAVLSGAGTEQVLCDLLPHHPRDPRIEKVVKTLLPFLRG